MILHAEVTKEGLLRVKDPLKQAYVDTSVWITLVEGIFEYQWIVALKRSIKKLWIFYIIPRILA